jgi:hypothetical protein
MKNQIMKVRRAIRRFVSGLSIRRNAAPPDSATDRERFEDLRRAQPHRWEIRPPSSECELPFGTELAKFHDQTASRVTEEAAGRIKISVSRLR